MPKKLTFDEVNQLFNDCGYKLMEDKYINSQTKMKYQCPKHPNEETYIRVSDLKNGVRCPYCAGLGRGKLKNIAIEFKNRNYELLEDTYINNKTKMRYKCLYHPDEMQTIRYDSFSNGRGCKYCGREKVAAKKRLSLESVREEFKNRGYILLENEYLNNRQKLRYICPDHTDKETYITYSSFQQGVGCDYCGGTAKLTFEEVKSLFESKNYTLLEKEYVNVETKMKCYCNNHKNYIQNITTHYLRGGYGCPYCAGKKATYTTSLGAIYPTLIKEWNYDKNDLSPFEYLPKSNKSAWWKCNECDYEWNTVISNRTQHDSGCPQCAESKGEKRIRNWLISQGISYNSQKTFDGLIGLKGGSLSFDFFVPKKNILIEFQGEQHYKFIKGLHGNIDNFNKQKEHDNIKRKFAKDNNMKLLEISYEQICDTESILFKEFKV